MIDGVWCIELRQGPGQSLKSIAARRTVPIHENLIELGLLRLHALRQTEDEPRLFPWLERSQAKQTLTETFSKRFTEYRKTNRIYAPRRDFHAFRTTFNHQLIETECLDSQRRYLMGHVDRDVGIRHYNPKGFSNRNLLKRVNAVKIDISMIRRPFGRSTPSRVTRISDHRAALSLLAGA